MDVQHPPPHPFGAELRSRRHAAGLSQKRLSALIDVSDVWVGVLEAGTEKYSGGRRQARPSPKCAVLIAHTLNWDVREALALAGYDPEAFSTQQRAVVEALLESFTRSADLVETS